MRVLLIAGMYPPAMCGVGDYTLHLAGAIQTQQGMQVGLLTHEPVDPLPTGVQCVHFSGGWQWTAFMKMWRALLDYQADIVHLQYPSLGYRRCFSPILLALLARISGIRLIVTLHEPLRRWSLPWFWALVFGAKSIVYVRHNYFDLLHRIQAWYLRKRPHSLILNASAIPTSQLHASDREALRQYHLQGKKRLVCYFGFVFPGKGIEVLLDVVQTETDRLILAGAQPDAVYLAQLHTLICKKALTDNVHLTGVMPAVQVADLLACADAVVLPLPLGAGSWNTTVHSALAQGSTVITTTLEEPRQDLQRNLFFVKPGDIQAMRDLLNRYAGHKVKPHSTYVQWQRIAQAHVQVYQSLGVGHA
jgi:glycosyltransferase involved in cell wall biosynthesis